MSDSDDDGLIGMDFHPRLFDPNKPKSNQLIEAGAARAGLGVSGSTGSAQSLAQGVMNLIIGILQVGIAYWQRDNQCPTDPMSIKLLLFVNGWVLILIGVANLGLFIMEALGTIGGCVEPLVSQVGYVYTCPANVIVTAAGLIAMLALNILGVVLALQAVAKDGSLCGDILIILIVFVTLWFVGTVIVLVINLGCCIVGCGGKYVVQLAAAFVMDAFGKKKPSRGDDDQMI